MGKVEVKIVPQDELNVFTVKVMFTVEYMCGLQFPFYEFNNDWASA